MRVTRVADPTPAHTLTNGSFTIFLLNQVELNASRYKNPELEIDL